MKKTLLACLIACCFVSTAFSSGIKVISGKADFLKQDSKVSMVYTYDNMQVGKMTETDYVYKKVADYNEKEAGKGDLWAEKWTNARGERYQPKFEELFLKILEKKNITIVESDADYRLEINTNMTEPGWNVGVMRQNAEVSLTCNVYEVATNKQVARMSIYASANDFFGTDFDVAYRVQECYAKAGREFAKFLLKKSK
jgi:hypothetical protein